MERYLVTGGAGFIGSHIVETLVKNGHFVRVIDDFDTGQRKNLSMFTNELELVEGSIVVPKTIAKAVEGIDYVFHEAARGSVPRSVEDPVGTHENNVTGTLMVLEAARKAGVRKVVCASSSSVYGETEELPKRESMNPAPKSPYATSKLALEHYVKLYSDVYGLDAVALRYFNVFGPRQNPNLQYAAVVPIFIRNMLLNKPCTIYGDGEQTRDFTYVADCVYANLLAAKTSGISGGVFNIACAGQITVNQLFQELKKILNYKMDPIYEPVRAGDIKYSYADIDLATKRLGFVPQVSLKEGLNKTVEWYQKEISS